MIQKYDTFQQDGFPPSNVQVQVLVEDPTGNYFTPFNCFYRNDQWVGVGAGKPLQVKVIGWRKSGPPSWKGYR